MIRDDEDLFDDPLIDDPPMPSRYRVLVIDDQPDVCHLISHALRRSDMPLDIVAAGNGPEGLALSRADPPDLIILDVMMPEVDGFEVCQRLRADAGTYRTPILMLTALNEPTTRTRGFLAGIDDYLAKPFDHAELLARVRRILQRTYGYADLDLEVDASATRH